jgi:hypothetical protein
MEKYKPTPRYKILAVYWWNPFFWLYLLFAVIVIGAIQGISDGTKMAISELKEWDLF